MPGLDPMYLPPQADTMSCADCLPISASLPTPPEVLPGILPLNLLVLHPCLHSWLLEESKLKCCLCWLPRMIVTKDHILSDVKQQKFVLHNSGGFLLFFSCSVMFNSL